MKIFVGHIRCIYLSILVVLLMAMGNCKEPPKEQRYLGTYPLGDIKDYLYFKPGSMWVYECDSTGELDTQVMVSIDTPWFVETYIKYQEFDRVIQSKNEGSRYVDTRIKSGIPYSENFSYFWYLTRWRSNSANSGYGTDCVFFKNYDTASLGGFGSSSTRYKGLLTNYSVLGKTYDTVRVFKVQATSGWPKNNSWRYPRLNYLTSVEYYWAKGTGLIKLRVYAWDKVSEEPFTHNWNLKEYRIVK